MQAAVLDQLNEAGAKLRVEIECEMPSAGLPQASTYILVLAEKHMDGWASWRLAWCGWECKCACLLPYPRCGEAGRSSERGNSAGGPAGCPVGRAYVRTYVGRTCYLVVVVSPLQPPVSDPTLGLARIMHCLPTSYHAYVCVSPSSLSFFSSTFLAAVHGRRMAFTSAQRCVLLSM
jgi:hypothetical protein